MINKRSHFTKKRFLQLDPPSQHKKCCELIKAYIREEGSQGNHVSRLQSEYSAWCEWMQISPLSSWDICSVESRFHWHTERTGRGIKEHDFLIHLRRGDRKETVHPWLHVTTYLDGLRSAHNIGTIIRTIEAFRLGPVVFSSDMPSPDHPQILKTSMSTWQHVSVRREEAEGSEIAPPRPWIAIETVEGAPSWNSISYPDSCTLFFGNEERGLRPSILARCDMALTVPLYGLKNSLNVANCHAIIAAEVVSQLRKKM